MAGTTATLTITLGTKEASLSIVPAIRESVTLTLAGTTGYSAPDLALGLVAVVGGVKTLMAKATFTGSPPVGTLDLNTVPLVAYFNGYAPNVERKVFVVVWDLPHEATLCIDQVDIRNNPYQNGMADPAKVDPIGALEYAPLSMGVTGGDSHVHHTGDGGTIHHSYLSEIGTLTHAQLEAAIALLADAATVTAALALKVDKTPTNGSFRVKDGQHIQFWNPVTGMWHTLIPYGSEGAVQTSWGPGEA